MKKELFAAMILAGLAGPTLAETEAELAGKVDQINSELDAVKAELKRLKEQQGAQQTQIEDAKSTVDTAARSANSPATRIFGYGEINYNAPTDNSSAAQVDIRRAVLGIGHRFNETTRFLMEIEIEHAIASADDAGEVEVEQLYIEHQLMPSLSVDMGLFLMPVGLLNRTHEPTAYYGVERNFVETAIIPTTWREVGVALRGHAESGLQWSAGITTGFDLTKWDPTSTEGTESPLGSIHQEGQLAKAHDPAFHGSLEYKGVSNLLVGGSLFTGGAGQGQPGFLAENARITLWDVHARWTPGKWDLAALYAMGTISDTQALNLTFAGNPTPVPKEFFGWYLQGAYKVWTRGDSALAPFIRYEEFNTASKYETQPPGLGVPERETEKVVTVGANFYLNPHVVIKADYQRFDVDSTLDRYDIGLGYMF